MEVEGWGPGSQLQTPDVVHGNVVDTIVVAHLRVIV